MNLQLCRILEVFPHFNQKPLTETDFWRACRKEKILVRQIPLPVDGYYTRTKQRHYILINSRLTGFKWLHTALHEFSHYLFDVPGEMEANALFRGRKATRDDIREKFADAFALVCLMPMTDLVKISPADVNDDIWLANIVRDRIAVRTDFGI
jgi:Zn-dependent peptidase ImmA (M78 family)